MFEGLLKSSTARNEWGLRDLVLPHVSERTLVEGGLMISFQEELKKSSQNINMAEDVKQFHSSCKYNYIDGERHSLFRLKKEN